MANTTTPNGSQSHALGWTVAVIIIVVAIILIAMNYRHPIGMSSGTGHIVVAVTDAAANMGAVSDVTLSADKVEMHNAAEGWVTVGSGSRDFHLLQLRDQHRSQLFVQANVAAGDYDQVRVHLRSVAVVTSTTTTNAALPSNDLTFNSRVTVAANTTSTVALDVLADQSLYVTTKGKYVFAPVVKVENRSSAQVAVASDDTVAVNSGAVTASATFGTDLSGQTSNGFRLGSNVQIDLNASTGGLIQVGGSGSGSASSSSSGGLQINTGGNSSGSGGVNVNVGGSGGGVINY